MGSRCAIRETLWMVVHLIRTIGPEGLSPTLGLGLGPIKVGRDQRIPILAGALVEWREDGRCLTE